MILVVIWRHPGTIGGGVLTPRADRAAATGGHYGKQAVEGYLFRSYPTG